MKRFLWLPLLLLGCSRESDVRVYKVPKLPQGAPAGTLPLGHPPMEGAMPPGAAPGGGMEAPASTALAWDDPPGWKREAGSGMRVASYKVPGDVEVTIISLAGAAGGDLDNVNRWRGQVGLPPIKTLEGAVIPVETGHGAGRMVEFDGAGAHAGKKMVAVIKDEHGTAWFFKMTGPAAAVAKAKPALVQMLRSLRHG